MNDIFEKYGEVMTCKEVAQLMKVTEASVRRIIRKECIPFHWFGKTMRFYTGDIKDHWDRDPEMVSHHNEVFRDVKKRSRESDTEVPVVNDPWDPSERF